MDGGRGSKRSAPTAAEQAKRSSKESAPTEEGTAPKVEKVEKAVQTEADFSLCGSFAELFGFLQKAGWKGPAKTKKQLYIILFKKNEKAVMSPQPAKHQPLDPAFGGEARLYIGIRERGDEEARQYFHRIICNQNPGDAAPGWVRKWYDEEFVRGGALWKVDSAAHERAVCCFPPVYHTLNEVHARFRS